MERQEEQNQDVSSASDHNNDPPLPHILSAAEMHAELMRRQDAAPLRPAGLLPGSRANLKQMEAMAICKEAVTRGEISPLWWSTLPSYALVMGAIGFAFGTFKDAHHRTVADADGQVLTVRQNLWKAALSKGLRFTNMMLAFVAAEKLTEYTRHVKDGYEMILGGIAGGAYFGSTRKMRKTSFRGPFVLLGMSVGAGMAIVPAVAVHYLALTDQRRLHSYFITPQSILRPSEMDLLPSPPPRPPSPTKSSLPSPPPAATTQ